MYDGIPQTKLWDLACAYMTAKERVIESGYSHEIDWQDSLDLNSLTEQHFLREAAWVVLSCGIRESIVRRLFQHVSDAFFGWESAAQIITKQKSCRRSALRYFNNPRKIDSIITITAHVLEQGFTTVREQVWDYGVDYIAQFPFMGPATSYHFAKNIGLRVAKPDRHLRRIATTVGYNSPNIMCQDIAQLIGEKASVVDIVMWRYAVLDKNYLELFSEKGLQHSTNGDRGFCWLASV